MFCIKKRALYMMQFKPMREKKEIISLRLSAKLLKEIEEKAREYGINRNELIVQSIRYALDHIDDGKLSV